MGSGMRTREDAEVLALVRIRLIWGHLGSGTFTKGDVVARD